MMATALHRKLLIGFVAGALVGTGVGVTFAPVTSLGWLSVLTISNVFGLAGLVVGWLGWRRSCSKISVALLGFIIPLISFLAIIQSPIISSINRYSGWELWGWVIVVPLWFFLNTTFGWLATSSIAWASSKGKFVGFGA